MSRPKFFDFSICIHENKLFCSNFFNNIGRYFFHIRILVQYYESNMYIVVFKNTKIRLRV